MYSIHDDNNALYLCGGMAAASISIPNVLNALHNFCIILQLSQSQLTPQICVMKSFNNKLSTHYLLLSKNAPSLVDNKSSLGNHPLQVYILPILLWLQRSGCSKAPAISDLES